MLVGVKYVYSFSTDEYIYVLIADYIQLKLKMFICVILNNIYDISNQVFCESTALDLFYDTLHTKP